jgi:hypothetical protein
MADTFGESLEDVYFEACRNLRDTWLRKDDVTQKWAVLCEAIENCYPDQTEHIRKRLR